MKFLQLCKIIINNRLPYKRFVLCYCVSARGSNANSEHKSYLFVIEIPSGAHSGPTFCYGFRVERRVSWKRYATGFEIVFSCLVGVSEMSANQQQHVYKPHGLKETAHNVSK